ncbi:MAG: DNA replication and repair protein RecF [Deltaproteobacteria bacterium]|nr:DNA replication and repair protein RecF [Deltaproteobacteria bacterium]
MIFQRVETFQFRNLAAQAVTLHPRFNVLAGNNGQGKTNFLEAAYLLACRSSFRAVRARELLRHGTMEAWVDARLDEDGIERHLRITLGPKGRRIRLDGKVAHETSEQLRGLAAILFTPEDLVVPRGSPARRRRLVDEAVGALWPAYRVLVRDYARALQSRNRLLRDRPRELEELLTVYDAQLAGLGAKICATRQRYLRQVTPGFSDRYQRVAQGCGHAELRYATHPEVLAAGDALPALAEALGRLLRLGRAQDLARRLTASAGPHLDDVEFRLDGEPARLFASQGQVRTLVLAFRISQIIDIYQQYKHYPLLLLDDVSSELDPLRNEYLFKILNEIECQVLITTTRPELIPIRDNRFNFNVLDGRISPLS